MMIGGGTFRRSWLWLWLWQAGSLGRLSLLPPSKIFATTGATDLRKVSTGSPDCADASCDKKKRKTPRRNFLRRCRVF
jgi:hypothetical protein